MDKEFTRFNEEPPVVTVTRGPFIFEGMHSLAGVVPKGHKCEPLHGHTYWVWVELTGPLVNKMVHGIEFSVIDTAMEPIIRSVCHRNLNDQIENPSLEVIGYWFAKLLHKVLRVPVTIEVKEGERSRARASYGA